MIIWNPLVNNGILLNPSLREIAWPSLAMKGKFFDIPKP